MSVHEAITRHSLNQQRHLEAFQKLDEQREGQIEAALHKCLGNEPFTVDEINRVTKQINDHAKQGISPTRRIVTEQMVRKYAAKSKQSQ